MDESIASHNGAEMTARVNLGLALLSRVAMPGVRYSYDEIGAWAGCTNSAIQQIEQRALKKLRKRLRLQHDPLLTELVAQVFEARRPATRRGDE